MTEDHDERAIDDVLVVGQLFVDAVYGGLERAPQLGHEIWDPHFTIGAGGIANHAIALSRLGARVELRAAIGSGPISDLARTLLSAEGIDTAGLTAAPEGDLPLTTALSYDGDRALVTGGEPASTPIATLLNGARPAGTAIVHWDGDEAGMTALRSLVGTVIADIGSDVVERHGTALPGLLAGVDIFVPNAQEAMAITATAHPEAALEALAAHIPLPIITLGADGALAIDPNTGERVHAPALTIAVVDTTGAGDVFGAAIAFAADLPLPARLNFAILVAGLCVSRAGGVSTAPRRSEVGAWLDAHSSDPAYARFDACRAALQPRRPLTAHH